MAVIVTPLSNAEEIIQDSYICMKRGLAAWCRGDTSTARATPLIDIEPAVSLTSVL